MVAKFPSFQAVVLAGGIGNRMLNVTEHVSKALLPLANLPLFWYPLHVLSENGINNVLLIANEDNCVQIKGLLDSGSLPALPGLEVEVVSPGPQEEDWGTADVLRHFANKITSDFILMGCDFVSDINLRNMIDFHRTRKSIMTVLLSNQACNSTAPGPKEMQKYRDFVALSSSTGQVVYLQSEEDLESDVIDLDPQIISRLKDVELTCNHIDCHVYLMDKRILHVLEWERDITMIKADLIPFLVEKQYDPDDLSRLFQNPQLVDHAFELRRGVEVEPPFGIRLFGYKTTREAVNTIARCNTLGAYIEANKTLLDQNPPFIPEFKQEQFPGNKVHVIKSRVGKGTQIGLENLKIVKSSIGERCVILNNAKIEDSIIFNNVKIGNGTKITRCIVSEGAVIGDNCTLEGCIVDKDHNLEMKTSVKNEFIRTEVEMNIADY
ncbi:unnamed protein product [Bursaphelenchus xylophilus]|uniref:Translation initiation factor eIF2B subunit gamma n=1 Tax=Bursaphelenchus xylophilus TaxID=6326 RepID=A0A1I7SS85_BURXY|nr:unnamed protein product [Bursaphelenchus xylophilus]CAG9097925.1 unnamed protein product [Bursaphelenchus xylophilus]